MQRRQGKQYRRASLHRKYRIEVDHKIPPWPISTIELNRLHRILLWQSDLRRRNRCRDFIEACRFDVVAVAIHLQAQLPRLSIDYPPHSVGATKGLVSLQAMPRVACNSVIPPRAELGQPGVLWLELEGRNLHFAVSNLQV